jgi:hypothetical protein
VPPQPIAGEPSPAPAPPPLGAPAAERPPKTDAIASLFGGLAETSEAPIVAEAEMFATAPAAPPAPVYTPEPAFAAQPAPPVAPVADPHQDHVASAPPAPASGTASPAGYSAAPPSTDDPTAGTQFFGGGQGGYEDPPDLDRTTTGEKVAFVLAFLVPPAGLIASIVAAAQSARRRGWVHGFVKAALVISIVATIAAGIGGAFAYKAFDDAQKHAALEAASGQFCATVAEQPDMITPPTFGFPGPGASIPETVESIQAFIDRFDALADVSPSGIRPDVTRVADVARELLATIEDTRLVDNEQNVAAMTTVAESTGIVAWADEYC